LFQHPGNFDLFKKRTSSASNSSCRVMPLCRRTKGSKWQLTESTVSAWTVGDSEKHVFIPEKLTNILPEGKCWM